MGMDQTVQFAAGKVPSWEAVRNLLAGRGFAVRALMIDGQLAFPDELPPEGWRELRVGTPQGMATLRRDGERVAFVTWGNADRTMLQAWNALVWAFAEAGDGTILTPERELTAKEYRQTSDLPEALR